jgi:hypothetical protein
MAGSQWDMEDGDLPTFELPSNGWTPDQLMMAMQVRGEFHAEMTEHGAEAWVGERDPTTWPKDYKVRFAPTELIRPDGKVVAAEGDEISSGGGFSPPSRENPKGILLVQGWPQRVARQVD